MTKTLLKRLLAPAISAFLAIAGIIATVNIANADQPNPENLSLELTEFTNIGDVYYLTADDTAFLIFQTKINGVPAYLPNDYYISIRTSDDQPVQTVGTPIGGQEGQYIVDAANPLVSGMYVAYIYNSEPGNNNDPGVDGALSGTKISLWVYSVSQVTTTPGFPEAGDTITAKSVITMGGQPLGAIVPFIFSVNDGSGAKLAVSSYDVNTAEFSTTMNNAAQGTYTFGIYDNSNLRLLESTQTTVTVDQKHVISLELKDFAKSFDSYFVTTDDVNLVLKTTVDGIQKDLPTGYGISAMTKANFKPVEGFAIESLGNGEYLVKPNMESGDYIIYVYKGDNTPTLLIGYIEIYVINLAPVIITEQPFAEGMTDEIDVYANSTIKINNGELSVFPYQTLVEKDGQPLNPGADTYLPKGPSTITFPSPKAG